MRPIALVVLVPFVAFAQTSTPEPAAPAAAAPAPAEPAARDRANWSIGAGIAGTNVYLYSVGSSMLVIEQRAPVGAASLERRISGGTWLVLGLEATYDRRKSENAVSMSTTATDEYLYGRLSLGIRHVVSPARAPVDVSVVALAMGGTSRLKSTTEDAGIESTNESTGWSLGAEAGIAIDRVLTGGLSVRLATPLLSAGLGRAKMTPAGGGPEVKYDAVTFAAVIAPRIELRLEF